MTSSYPYQGHCIGGPYHGMKLAHYSKVHKVPLLRSDMMNVYPLLEVPDISTVDGEYIWAEDKWVWREPGVDYELHVQKRLR